MIRVGAANTLHVDQPENLPGRVEPVSLGMEGEVDAYVRSHPDATVYHLRGWCEVFRSLGYKSFEVVARDETGALRGFLRLFLVRGLSGRRLVAVPFRDRGGPLWDEPWALELLLQSAQRLALEQRAGELVFKSIERFPDSVVENNGIQVRDHWIRSVVDLSDRTADGYFTAVGAKTRNMVRQAERSELSFHHVTNPSDGLSDWHELHLATQHELGVPAFSKRFFASMFQELGPTQHAQLYLVRRGTETLSGCIIFRLAAKAIYGYSASRQNQRKFRPNDFMLSRLIVQLISEKVTEFDMGSDSPSQESLLFFKRKWLACQTVVPLYFAGDRAGGIRDSSESRYDFLRRVVRAMPLSLYRTLGYVPTRFFG